MPKGKLTWRQNADIAGRQATDMDARTAQTGYMSIETTRSTANGAARRATATGAHTARIGYTGMAQAATSVSGAVRRPTALAVHTPRRADMRSDGIARHVRPSSTRHPRAKAGMRTPILLRE